MKQPVFLHAVGAVCTLGRRHELAQGLFSGQRDTLTMTDDYTPGQVLPVGRVHCELPEVGHLPAYQQSRCNRLLLAALEELEPHLQQHLERVDPLRVGVVLGTSTAGIAEGERAMAQREAGKGWPANYSYQQQEMYAPAESLARWLGARGPAFTISTACSSGAKALASARRLLREGICDLVIAGGADVLCSLTVRGFSSLESVSDEVCNPSSRNRKGINIGEAASLFIVSCEPGPVALSGVGETSDAHHISAPAPDGAGAAAAMQIALADAGLRPEQVDYLNLHGTATPQNDRMESLALHSSGLAAVPCSSTKAYTGHTLGAAGALEAAFGWLTLMQDQLEGFEGCWHLPVQLWDQEVDPELAPLNVVSAPTQVERPRCVMSNSFAFGGNNITLILERQ